MRPESMDQETFDSILIAAIVLAAGDTELSSFAAGFKEACHLFKAPCPVFVDQKRENTTAGAAALLVFMGESKRVAAECCAEIPLLPVIAKEIEDLAKTVCGDTEKIAKEARAAMGKDMKFKRKEKS